MIRRLFFQLILLSNFLFFVTRSFSYSIEIIVNDSLKVKSKKTPLIVPLLFYAPETRIGTGLAYLGYFHFSVKDTAYRHSILIPEFAYTQNKQIYLEIPFTFFISKEHYYIYGNLGAYNYPYKFYGIGNEQLNNHGELYNAKYYSLTLNILKKYLNKTYIGIRYNINNYHIDKLSSTGLLKNNNVFGIKGGLTTGLGIMGIFDSRNNIFSTTNGSYIEMSYTLNNKLLFSNYSFNFLILDIRKFHAFYKKNILAFQIYLNDITGNAPFYNLSLLGGEKTLRGYYLGRYRDKGYFSTQIEYRSPYFKNRLGLVTFTGLGIVFDNISAVKEENLKPSYGAGIRIKFDRKENLSFRIDMAFGYKSVGYYFIVNEAF